MQFVDEVRIFVTGGNGGNGCVSFRREKFVPKGGPDGGDGGNGGSVYLAGNKKLMTLYDLKIKPHYRAGRGGHGKGKKMHGRKGKDIFIPVPVGVVARNDTDLLGEIMYHGENLLIARGGRGGRGNVHFVSSRNRAPRRAEEGSAGEDTTVHIVLKLISDIGLVGFPNSGKSTLLAAMSNAQPKIADYPFTTLNPNLGVLAHDLNNIVIADMPGIIEGAHQGKGLGFQFLRHIERTRLLVLVIDISGDPLAHYHGLLEEFRAYNPQLVQKPRIVVFNKIDLVKDIPRFDVSEKTFYVSARDGTHIDDLIKYLSNENTIQTQ
ncbi:MAG: GTPase ObgE [candidate division WOR-3 bacterium]|nr:MAG: GTPase ObgE [candidate division WOR-3 bacterium]